MKKIIKLFCLVLFACLLTFVVGCGESSGDDEKNKKNDKIQFEVKYYDGANLLFTEKVNKGEKALGYSGEKQPASWYRIVNGEENEFSFDTPIEMNIDLHAKYKYKYTFLNGDGSVLKVVEAYEGDYLEIEDIPTKESDGITEYTFKEWDKDLDAPGEDTTFSPIFRERNIGKTVIFYDKAGNRLDSILVAAGGTVDAIDYKVEDDNLYTYKMIGWKTSDGKEYDFNTKVNDSLMLYPLFERTPKPFDLTGKKLSIMGDSVSTFYKNGDPISSYYHETNQYYYPMYCGSVDSSSKTYWVQLLNKTGMVLGINESYSGTTCSGSGNTVGCSQYRVDHLGLNGDPDVIITFLGINDNASGVPTATLRTAYNSMLKKIEAKYPNAYIFVVLHPYSNYHLNQPDNHAKYSEETRLEYNEMLKELVKEHQVGQINLDQCQTTETWKQYLNDNLHPNTTGHKAWAEQFYKDITAYFAQANAQTTEVEE